MDYFVSVLEKFAPLSGIPIPVYEDKELLAQVILSNPDTIYIEEPGKGLILGMIAPHWWNPSITVAQELGWWVEPEYRGTSVGIKLLKRFEQEAKAKGAQHIFMLCLEAQNPDKVEAIYNKLGYSKIERTFMKQV